MSNADLASRDENSDDEDDSSNHQLQKRNLFQSLQHKPNASLLSIKSGTSSQAQSDSSRWNLMKKKPENSNSSNISSVPSTHSESSQQNSSMTKTLPSDPNHALLKPEKYLNLKDSDTHNDATNDYGQLVITPTSPIDFNLFTSPSKTTNGNGVSSTPQVEEMVEDSAAESGKEVDLKDPLSSTSVSHHDVPMVQPSVTQTVQPSVKQTSQSDGDLVIRNDDNLDAQQASPETNNLPDSPPITQPLPLDSKNILEGDSEIVSEISVPGEYPSVEPSTSPTVQSPPLNSTMTDSNPIPPKDNTPVKKVQARRKPSQSSMMNSFLLNMVTPKVVVPEVPEKVRSPKTQQWRPPLGSLQRISESGDSLASLASDEFTPAPDGLLARKMEELGRLRRMESRNLLSQPMTSPEALPSRTIVTPKAEPLAARPQLQTLQEGISSDVSTLLREAYIERQQSLQTQLNKALAELRDVQAENKRLTSENQSQQRSISQLKTALDDAKHQKDSSTQIKNQLRVANSSLAILNEEKKGWQDKLDSMQHKLNAAERQVRCLDHLTRNKLESRQEAGYGPPKRRGAFTSVPASTDVIGAMRALNEEIYQTCVQFVDGLERTSVFSTRQKPQVKKVLGDHLTALMEDQAKTTTSGYNMLLMQTVLEVFMTHWCSSIIEAFYPRQESFADLLVQLSAQTSTSHGK
jgi:hypothetical protein